jgi:ketosteroid isomerase-like protein
VTSERRALIEDFYRRLNARNTQVFDLCHEELEWFWPDSTPGGSVFRGRQEVIGGLDMWADSWGELTMDPDEIIEEDDYVLVIATYRMRGAGSGMYLEQEVPHLHHFEDGVLRRWWIFGDVEKARRRFEAGDRPG